MRNITVRRTPSLNGFAVLFEVLFDDETISPLANGGEIVLEADENEHSLRVRNPVLGNETQTLTVPAGAEDRRYVCEIRAKTQGWIGRTASFVLEETE